MDSRDTVRLVISVCICLAFGLIGSFFTVSGIITWYAALNKPFFSPPDWLFAPAWTLLYILMGTALFLVWRSPKDEKTNLGLMLFGAQLILNLLWSIVFFSFKSLPGSVITIFALLLLIVLTTLQFYRIDKRAAYLMLPYILWVCFATLLNISIYLLNP